MAEETEKEPQYISLQEATQYCSYSQDYLSLRARQRKLKALKIGRNWVTTIGWVQEYSETAAENNKNSQLSKTVPPPENLPVTEKAFSEIAVLKFNRVSPWPKVKFGLALTLAFLFLIAGTIYGQNSIKDVFGDIDSGLRKISQKIEASSINYRISQGLGEQMDSLKSAVSFIDRYFPAKEASLYFSAGLKNTLGQGWQNIKGFFSDLGKEIQQTLKGEELAEGEKEITTPALENKIKQLTEEIKKLKVEGPIAKEIVREIKVSEITKIEPIKEITKETIKIDEKALGEVRASLTNIDTRISSLGNRVSYAFESPRPSSGIGDQAVIGSLAVSGGINEGGVALAYIYTRIPAGSVQGDIFYRNATTWTRLPAGVAGQFLQTAGAGADPAWANFAVGAIPLNSANILVGNALNQAAAVAMTGDVAIDNLGATTIQANSVALTTDTTGNYVLSITNGSGISGGDGGSEGAVLNLSLGNLTADWTQAGAFNILTAGNIGILEGGAGPTLYGILDVADLSGAGNSTYTFPDLAAGSDTVVLLAAAQSLTNKTGYNGLVVTANTGVITTGTWQGTAVAVNFGGTGADLSLTGGANQFVKQSGAGAVFTVGAIADADVPDSITLTNITQITNRAITDTTGTLTVTRGGTGLATIAQGGILYSSALDTLSRLAPAGANLVLRSTGANALEIGSLVAADIPNLDVSKITTGTLGLARGGTGADLSATGGANQFVKQSGAGAVFTVGAIADADVPDTITASNYLLLAGGTMAGNIDLNTNLLLNIGNAGTDFVAATGGLNLAGDLGIAGGDLNLTNGTSNLINFGTAGTAVPSDSSAGFKIKLYDDPAPDYDVGIGMTDSTTMWFLSASSGGEFQWWFDYLGTKYERMTLTITDLVIENAIDANNTGTHDFEGALQIDMLGAATINGICHSGSDSDTTAGDRNLVVCSATPGDIAEWYETREDVEAGDLVAISQDLFQYQSDQVDPLTGELLPEKVTNTIAVIEKTNKSYQPSLLGIVSTSPYQTFGRAVIEYASNPLAVSLIGRVPLKVSTENGPIEPGDPLTSSSTPGVAMKAIRSGPVVGKALEPFPKEGQDPSTSSGQVMVFVNVSYYLEQDLIAQAIESSIDNSFFNPLHLLATDLTRFFKEGLAKLGLFVEDGIAQVKELITDKITTKKLCVEDVCVNRNQLKELLEKTQNPNVIIINNQAQNPSAPIGQEQPPTQPSEEPSIETLPIEEVSAEEPPAAEEPLQNFDEQNLGGQTPAEEPAENSAS